MTLKTDGVLQKPAGRTTTKGMLEKQLFSTVLKNNTYSKSGAYRNEDIYSRGEIIEFI